MKSLLSEKVITKNIYLHPKHPNIHINGRGASQKVFRRKFTANFAWQPRFFAVSRFSILKIENCVGEFAGCYFFFGCEKNIKIYKLRSNGEQKLQKRL